MLKIITQININIYIIQTAYALYSLSLLYCTLKWYVEYMTNKNLTLSNIHLHLMENCHGHSFWPFIQNDIHYCMKMYIHTINIISSTSFGQNGSVMCYWAAKLSFFPFHVVICLPLLSVKTLRTSDTNIIYNSQSKFMNKIVLYVFEDDHIQHKNSQNRWISYLAHSWPSVQPVTVQQVFLPSDITVSTPTHCCVSPTLKTQLQPPSAGTTQSTFTQLDRTVLHIN